MSDKTDDTPSILELAKRPALVLVVLLVILAGNVGLAFVPLGGFEFTANLVLAAVSVSLIGFFFMELDKETGLNRLFSATGFAWLIILFMLLFADYFTRY